MTLVGLLRKILFFPLTRMIFAFVVVVVANVAVGSAIQRFSTPTKLFAVVSAAIHVVTSWAAYAGYVRLLERRPAIELSRHGALSELATGAAIGFGLFTATIGCLWLGGYYRVQAVGLLPSAKTVVEIGVAAAFFEELLLRGIVFRMTEEMLGTWVAMVISALLFGLLHLGNPGATWTAAICIALEAGVLLAAAYILTRRLWLPIGMHFAWNVSQGGIYGVAISGAHVNGLLISTLTGPELISGGKFGAEASVFAVMICSAAAIYLIVLAVRDDRIVPPFWARTRAQPVAATAEQSVADVDLA
jgi:membrane protease YdiL (CAAX protease family)